MYAPFYSLRTQTLPVYTHEHVSAWAWFGDPCVIESRVHSGGTSLRKDPNDPLAIEHYTTNLAEEGQTLTV